MTRSLAGLTKSEAKTTTLVLTLGTPVAAGVGSFVLGIPGAATKRPRLALVGSVVGGLTGAAAFTYFVLRR